MLEARSLTKYCNRTLAVRQVSFTIQPGEILGYLGPNGAGKSTTVKMLTGLIEPSDGQIFFNGRSVYEDFTAFQRRIGYVPEEAHLYPHLSGREYLQLMGRLRGMDHRILEPKMDEFLRLLGLWNDRQAPLSSYSKGMRQKILLSAALLHNPDILILDEPSPDWASPPRSCCAACSAAWLRAARRSSVQFARSGGGGEDLLQRPDPDKRWLTIPSTTCVS